MKNIILILFILTLSGCATSWDVELWEEHSNSVQSSHRASEKIIQDKTVAIQSLGVCTNCTHTENLLMKVIMAGSIERMVTPQFTVKAPRINTDNVEPITKAAIGIAPFVVVERIVDKTASEIGDENYLSEGGDITVEKTEVHSTVIGDSNKMTSDYENTDINKVELAQ